MATLLDGGQTAHSSLILLFNVQITETPTCNIHKNFGMGVVVQSTHTVESIEIKDTYEADSGNYVDDIAIIVLKAEITISDFVRPVCVDLESKYEREQLSSGTFGSVTFSPTARLGSTERPASNDVILTTRLPFVEFGQCYELFPAPFRTFFTSDKFCAGSTNGSEVCLGDAVGGLLFEREVTATTKQWFIQGIASLSLPSRGGQMCSRYPVLFTKVNDHLDWLQTYYDKY
ncbi:phenoloxidase-activating factor 3-like [Schistocerca americana]|uniref:phenoloxidase-activating factor 3-like n=1 Tax=Schistocerca americana TaxID=7009 RepID=UPI001F4F5063|nr:phenoloxidase-activating factor 3-like [Schistocerca americana]